MGLMARESLVILDLCGCRKLQAEFGNVERQLQAQPGSELGDFRCFFLPQLFAEFGVILRRLAIVPILHQQFG